MTTVLTSTVVGKSLKKVSAELKPIEKILKSKTIVNQDKMNFVETISQFNSSLHTPLTHGFGGGNTVLGARTIVSLIGSASTGTAISSLSGIAATNATLAWFGGGSLAAGGAGMAGEYGRYLVLLRYQCFIFRLK